MPLTVQQCREVVEAFKATAPVAADAVCFVVGATQEELYGPKGRVEHIGVVLGGYRPGAIRSGGRDYRGRCDLVAASLRDARDLEWTLAHEIYGHFGLNTFERSEKRAILNAIVGARQSSALGGEWALADRYYPQLSQFQRAEEVFCFFAESASPSQELLAESAPDALREACLQPTRALTRADLASLAASVAVGLRDRTRRQLIFPADPDLQFQKDRTPRDDYARRVAAEVIRQLEAGAAPWLLPSPPGERRMPFNPVTGRDYRGMNALLLMMQGRSDARWLTRRQAEAQGARLRDGEQGRDVQLQFFAFSALDTVRSGAGDLGRTPDGRVEMQPVQLPRPRVTNFWVYSAEQFEGLPAAARRPDPGFATHAEAERLIAAMGVEVRHAAGDAAYYDVRRDRVVLPERSQFATADRYYATALHELGHATGHEHRLGRDLAHPFGSEARAREELRAEIASLVMGDRLGIGHDPGQHAAYIGSWIRALETDPREIFRAAADAERISDFILSGRGRALAVERAKAEARGWSAPEEVATAPETLPHRPRERDEPMPHDAPRRYIVIAFRDKEAAKTAARAAGVPLKWDRTARAWWTADTPEALAALEPWTMRAPPRPTPPGVEFGDVLRAAGFQLEGPAELDGRIHRVPLERDRRGELTGAYCGYDDGHPAGWYRDMSAGDAVTWTWSGAPALLTDAERRAQAAQAQARRSDRERAAQAMQAEVVARLADLLAGSEPAPDGHPYLLAKSVGPGGLRINRTGPVSLPPGAPDAQRFSGRGQLLAPYHDIDGRLMGVQSISGRALKSLAKGARLAGGMHLIGDPGEGAGPILIVEGWATGKTLSEATGAVVAVAFSAGNLSAVAEALKGRYPDRPLVIAGDNDHAKAGLPGPGGGLRGNAGFEAARAAAERVGGGVLLPEFRAGSMGSDWNDLFREDRSGFEAQLRAGLARLAAGVEIRHAADRASPRRSPRQLSPGPTLEPNGPAGTLLQR